MTPSVHRNLIANYIGQGWTAFINLAVIPIYISYLGIESYALVGVFTVVMTCFVALDAGMTPTLNREMARYSAGGHTTRSINDLVLSMEVLCAGLVVVLVGTGFLTADWLATNWLGATTLPHEVVSDALKLIAVVAALRVVEGVFRGALLGLQKHVWLTVSSAALATLRAAGAIAALKWLSPSIGAFFAWQSVVSLTAVIVFALATHRALPKGSARFSGAALTSVKAFAGGIVGTSVLALALSQADKVILARLLPLEAFGYYTVASTVANSLYQLVNPVAQTYYPRLTELVTLDDKFGLARAYHLGSQLLSAGLLPAATLLTFLGDRILGLWTSDPVMSAATAPLLALLAAGCLCNGIMHMPYMLQLANGWSGFSLRINLVSTAIYIPSLLLIVPRHGASGAAACWLTLNLATLLVSTPLMHRRLLPGEMWRWLLWDNLLPLACVGVLAMVSTRFLQPAASRGAELLLLLAIAGSAVVVCVLACSLLRRAAGQYLQAAGSILPNRC